MKTFSKIIFFMWNLCFSLNFKSYKKWKCSKRRYISGSKRSCAARVILFLRFLDKNKITFCRIRVFCKIRFFVKLDFLLKKIFLVTLSLSFFHFLAKFTFFCLKFQSLGVQSLGPKFGSPKFGTLKIWLFIDISWRYLKTLIV